MQAAILAGGLGTRLRPLTERLPKAMAPVGGRPFLWHLLRLAARSGVREAVLCTGYRGAEIRDYFGDGGRVGLRLAYSQEGERLLGTGGALKRAEPLLDRRFLLLYGDTYWPVDLAALAGRLQDPADLAAMGVYDNRDDTGVPNNVSLEGGRVARYEKGGGDAGLTHVEGGISALRREALDRLPAGRPSALDRDLFPPLAAERAIAAWPSPTRFYDIGTPERLLRLRRHLAGEPSGGSPA